LSDPGDQEGEEADAGDEQPAEGAEDEERHPPGLAAHRVGQHTQLQPRERADGDRASGLDTGRTYSHDSSSPVAIRPPTVSTKTCSRLRSPRTSASDPTALIEPSARIATWLHSRSTTSITWLEKMTVPPPATYRWRM